MGGDDSQKLLPWRGICLLSGAKADRYVSGSDPVGAVRAVLKRGLNDLAIVIEHFSTSFC